MSLSRALVTPKVLFLSPEVAPFAKTGGLADVAGALPMALKRLGVDVRLVLPLYRTVRDGGFESRHLFKGLEIPFGNQVIQADVLETQMEEGVPVYLINREDLYDRPDLYGNAMGDYDDNLERFAFFAHAALRIIQSVDYKANLIHCHDWQTGLVPALLKGPLGHEPFFKGIRTVFTVHNLGYQGLFPEEKFLVTGLPRDPFFFPEGLEYYGRVGLLKAGIQYADAITTVSPTYAREIQTSDYGMRMEGILQRRRDALYGVLNGVDYDL